MTQFSKVLTVFLLFGSLAFMGFAAITLVAGPNWQAETRNFRDFFFERSEGPQTTWTVKTRQSGQNVKTSPILPEVIAAAYQRKISNQREQRDQLKQQLTAVKQRLERTGKVLKANRQALRRHETRLVEQLKNQRQQIKDVSDRTIQLAQQTQSVQQQTARRRQDVFRLKALYEEIRTDQYRAMAQQEKQHDVLNRLQGRIARLEHRRQQFLEAGLIPSYEQNPEKPKPGDQ